ncbi:MAG: EmrA/EmrK family multidrug efflux transporter periplasmic adaptor subunit, partial [Alphaproteobacteria bacterium PA3]
MSDAAATAPAGDPPAVDPAVSAARKTARRVWLQRLVVGLAVAGSLWGGWHYLVNGAVSGEELTQARTAYAAASAALDAARGGISEVTSARRAAQGQLAANDALVRGSSAETDPAVRAARARLDAALLALARTEIRAPVAGVVSRLQVQIGQRLTPGQTIMPII